MSMMLDVEDALCPRCLVSMMLGVWDAWCL